ncbi:MAG TPA: 5-formyltetrahydrofolate cyclo-ligase [Flavitalea sp.]|nr:5-formyltetrahydrofolate cyclo-ligase [Flavitalea sp.]
MVKKEIRSIFIEKRNALTADELKEMTEKIVNNFRTIALQGAQVLLSYYPIPERREFNVILCEQLLSLENEQLQVAWPKLLPDNITMHAIAKNNDTVFAENRYNILEPVSNEIILPQLIDVVFVPLLAFDNKGYRVGYGKGFYDRYLPQCAQDVVIIGFSYFEALDAIDDVNEYDVPLNYCITPTRVYEF